MINDKQTPIGKSGAENPLNRLSQPETKFDNTPVGKSDSDGTGWGPGTVLLGQFRILKSVGSGGSGRVYQVEDLQTGMQHAMKIPNVGTNAGSLRQRLFFREIRNWIDLPVHPNLSACRFFRTIDGRIAIFAEFVDGGSLDELINRQSLTNIQEILDVAIQIARGLDAAHSAGVIHQDIKPGNILISTEGVAKITDFGLSRAHEILAPDDLPSLQTTQRTLDPTVSRGVMTPSYCSIEQKERRTLDRRSDIWSYGLTILTMFAGPTWWTDGAEGARILEKYIATSPRPPYPMLPESLRDVIESCLRVEPEDRWASMCDIIDRLIAIYREMFGIDYPRCPEGVFAVRGDAVGSDAPSSSAPTVPLAYRTAAEWLKKAVDLSLEAARALKMNPKIPHKSRKSELLHDMETLEEALRIYGLEFGRGRRELRDDMVHLLLTIARTHFAADDLSGAVSACDRAVAIMEKPPIFGDPPFNPGLLADIFSMKGDLLAEAGDATGSMAAHDQSILLCRVLPDAQIRSNSISRMIHALLSKSTSCGKLNRSAVAAELAREAARICVENKHILKRDDYHRLMAASANNEANAMQSAGQYEAAIGLYEEACRAFENVERYDDTQKREKLAILSMNRASVMIRMGRYAEALELLNRSVELLGHQIDILGRTEHRRDLAAALQHRAMALLGIGKPVDAREAIDRSIEIRECLFYTGGRMEVSRELAKAFHCKGQILEQSGDVQEAQAFFARSAALSARTSRPVS